MGLLKKEGNKLEIKMEKKIRVIDSTANGRNATKLWKGEEK